MDDDREAFESAYALYLARRVDRETAQMIVAASSTGIPLCTQSDIRM